MVTLKQLETLLWIVQAGSFQRAAARLNMTQSTVSKRIQELEREVGFTVFDRSSRSARLTEQGQQLLELGQSMVDIGTEIAQISNPKRLRRRPLRIGVTELVAMTWLPALVKHLRDDHPGLDIRTEVDLGRAIFNRLQQHGLDFAILPGAFHDRNVHSVQIDEVTNVWMSATGRLPEIQRLSNERRMPVTFISQGSQSGSGAWIEAWLRRKNFRFERSVACNSLLAIAGLIASGVGISYLPQSSFAPLVAAGRLHCIPSDPPLPSVPYTIMHHIDAPSEWVAPMVEAALRLSDFSGASRQSGLILNPVEPRSI